MKLWKPDSSYQAKKDGLWSALVDEVSTLTNTEAWWDDFQVRRLRSLPPVFQEPLRDLLDGRRQELLIAAQARAMDRQYMQAMERNDD